MATDYFISFNAFPTLPTPDSNAALGTKYLEDNGFREITRLQLGAESTGALGTIKTVAFDLASTLDVTDLEINLAVGKEFDQVTVIAVQSTGDRQFIASTLKFEVALLSSGSPSVSTTAASHGFEMAVAGLDWSVARADATASTFLTERTTAQPFDLGDGNSAEAPAFTDGLGGADEADFQAVRFDGAVGSAADVRIYMRYVAPGEANQGGRETVWHEIEDFSYDISTSSSFNNGGAGKAAFGTLSVTRPTDEASLLFAYLAETKATVGEIEIVVARDVGGSVLRA